MLSYNLTIPLSPLPLPISLSYASCQSEKKVLRNIFNTWTFVLRAHGFVGFLTAGGVYVSTTSGKQVSRQSRTVFKVDAYYLLTTVT